MRNIKSNKHDKKKFKNNIHLLIRFGVFTEQVQEEDFPTLHHLHHPEGNVVGGVALLQEHPVVGVSNEALRGAPHKQGVLPTQRNERDGQGGLIKLADLLRVGVLGR